MSTVYGVSLKAFMKQVGENLLKWDKEIQTYQNDIMAIYIYKIAEATAYDTRFTRDLFRHTLEDLGYPNLSAKLYVDPYDHWKSLQQRMKQGDTIRLSKNRGVYILVVESDAFDMLNTNPTMPSKKHPRGTDPKLQPFIVDYITDLFETEADIEMNNAIDVLAQKIVSLVEGRNKAIKRSRVVI